jgi:broad specificity phosphatase PhoE
VQSEQLLELEQGQWEGAVRRECFTPELTARFAADPWGLAWTFAPPGGESQKEVEERMAKYLRQVVLPGLRPGAPAIVVGHGMALKCLLRHLLGSLPTMSRNIAWNNTACTEIGFVPAPGNGSGGSEGTWHILRVNDTSHLPHELVS